MATTSEVKDGLDRIAEAIKTSRANLAEARAKVASVESELNALPTTFADVIATINAYAGGDAFENLSKAEKALLQTEFIAVRNAATAAKNAIDAA